MHIANEQKRLADASKRDSKAMKTLSLLGALFLPGTYLASVFSMGFFNFDAGELWHVEKRDLTVGGASFLYFMLFYTYTTISPSALGAQADDEDHRRQPGDFADNMGLLCHHSPRHGHHRDRVAAGGQAAAGQVREGGRGSGKEY